jgi:hypothetical protein
MRSKKLSVVAAALAAVASVLVVGQVNATSSYGWADGLAGCHTSAPAVAHYADRQALKPQPTDGAGALRHTDRLAGSGE